MKVLFICIGIAIVLSGCESGSPGAGYPGEARLPYPDDAGLRVQKTPSLPSIVPTPLPTKGTIVGRLYNSATGKPVSGIWLYFANLLPLTPGPEFFIALDPVNSPHVPIPEDGRFIMANIAPGRYALVLWTPQRASYVLDPNDPEKMLTVDISADRVMYLGELTATFP